MKVRFFGTRGSTPGTLLMQKHYGFNTTCIEVVSQCLPDKWALAIDTGTGFTQLSRDRIQSHPNMAVLYTHYHHDHTQGIFLAPHAYAPHARLRLYGPSEHKVGPREVMETLFRAPLFPVEFAKLQDRVECKPLEHIGTQVLVVHPEAGFHLLPLGKYRSAAKNGKQLQLGSRRESIKECLVVKMYKTVHPEYTVSYRFEEMPTGHTFVFLTDHENTAGIPHELLEHVRGAHLLVQDAQYSEAMYQTKTAGYGHGTPEYCVQLAMRGEVELLGITHHDPTAIDSDVESRLREAINFLRKSIEPKALRGVFACRDYQSYEFSSETLNFK